MEQGWIGFPYRGGCEMAGCGGGGWGTPRFYGFGMKAIYKLLESRTWGRAELVTRR